MTNRIKVNSIDRHDNCISLGCNCNTASSMAMHGLRSFSGPFDWHFSDLDSVLKVIETDFSDFMRKENLQVASDSSKVFFDTKYGFCYPHDIEINFEQEYPEIFEKYRRRAERFMEAVKYPTCFLRTVRSEEEILYIKENREYIYNVIKKRNPNNEIIFLLLKDMTDLPDDFLWFRLGIDRYISRDYEMCTMFDSSKEFIRYCQNDILLEETIKKNKCHGITGIVKRGLIMHRMEERDNSVELALKDYFPTIDQGIYLWGAGTYGILMLNYMIEYGIKINAVIDNSEDKIGTIMNGVSIISFSEVKKDGMNILIAVSSEKSIASIVEQINDKHPASKVLTLDNLYGYPMLPGLAWN